MCEGGGVAVPVLIRDHAPCGGEDAGGVVEVSLSAVECGFVEDEETVVRAEASGFGDDVEGFRVAEEFGEGICEGDPRCGGEMAEGGGSAAEEVEAFGGAVELAAGSEVVGGADFVMGGCVQRFRCEGLGGPRRRRERRGWRGRR